MKFPRSETAFSCPSSAAAWALVLFSSWALAQKAGLPDVRAGDQWKFAAYATVPSAIPNRAWVITSVTAIVIEGTENGEPLLLTRELNVLESPRSKESNPKALDFPLEVGKRWQYESDWVFKPKAAKGGIKVEVTVVGHEKVKVPAGEFDAFKLTARGSLRGTSPVNSQYAGETTETYWYAPMARTIVKSVRHNPYLGTATVELVEFQLER